MQIVILNLAGNAELRVLMAMTIMIRIQIGMTGINAVCVVVDAIEMITIPARIALII
ncbi:Uncharacterised protein [Chlamydia trachomatis]|nr:Uncharacterised protein [Chlamydia trachomatis]